MAVERDHDGRQVEYSRGFQHPLLPPHHPPVAGYVLFEWKQIDKSGFVANAHSHSTSGSHTSSLIKLHLSEVGDRPLGSIFTLSSPYHESKPALEDFMIPSTIGDWK